MRQIFTLFLLLFAVLTAEATTDRYRLMFNDDPATTVTVGWEQVSGSNPIVYYGTIDHGTNWASYSSNEPAYKTTSYMGMTNKFAVLTGLTPNTAYYFVIKDSDGTSQRYWFKTCPDNNNEKLSFISGGDSRSGQTQRQNSNRMVAKIRPHAVLFGGDLVNTPGNSSVQTWFDDWMLTITSDGQMFPIVHSFGNHEDYGTGGPEFISELFDTDYDVYYRVTFGGDLFSVYTLNGELLPGHTISNASKRNAQTAWLSSELQNDNAIWKSAQYHRPIVPHYSGKGEGDDEFDDWANLFYDYGVRLVMESDAHVTKMTEEVKPAMATASGNSSSWFTTTGLDPNKGITFIGEGAWGTIRTPDDSHPLTTAMTSMYQFAWITVDQCVIEIRTIDTQSPGTVPEHAAGDYFSISSGLDAQIWKPSGLTSGVREIRRCYPPVADFSANMTSAFGGQQIDFTDLSTNTPTSWSWDFGDGNTSTQQNPSNTYAAAGTYTVTLNATNADGTGIETKTDYIVISDPIAPIADFSVNNTTPNATENITFTDASLNNPTSWSWDFGDGNTSTQQNPVHAYASPGQYTVTLTASNPYGSDDEIKVAYVDVQSGGTVTVAITDGNDDVEEFRSGFNAGNMYLNSSDLEIGNDNLTEQYMGLRFQNVNVPQGATISNAKVTFRADESDGAGSQLNIYIVGEDADNAAVFTSNDYDLSNRSTTTAMYTWPDGSVPAWSSGNIYDTPDLSPVIQEIVDRAGWNSGNAMVLVFYSDMGETSERVGDSYEGGYPAELTFDWSVPAMVAPIADFTSNTSTICEGQDIDFNDISSNTPTSWSWDFGDGNTSTQQNPTHTYTTAGTYTVTLTASNPGGSDVQSQTDLITVTAAPNVVASNDQTVCSGDQVTISASGATDYTWDHGLGNGASKTVSPTVTTTYEVTGDDGVCTAIDQVTITVNALPIVTMNDFEEDTLCKGAGEFNLPAGSPSGGTYSGSGVSGNTFSPITAGEGVHIVDYVYTDGNGCTDTASKTIAIVTCLGVYDQENEPLFSIYPNPATERITIERDQPSTFSNISIYGVGGKLVYNKNVIDNPLTIHIGKWERGTYIIEFSNNKDQKVTKKIVIQ